MKIPVYILALLFPCLLQAAELFGVDLASADRDQMRNAVKTAGLTLISEAGDDAFFDSYESGSVLPGSLRLYLGFVKEDQKFAFAEYEFSGLKHPQLIEKLNRKYGQPSVKTGKYLSDEAYQWQSGGIEINLYADWTNYRTRLVYSVPQQLGRLRQEKALAKSQIGDGEQAVNDTAY